MGLERPSRLEFELREQGDVLAGRTGPGWPAADAAARMLAGDDVDYLVIAARGSSDNAARYAQYLLGSIARLPIALAAPWLYSSHSPPRLRRGAVLAISQSGRSPDIAAVLAVARAQGRPTVAITNDVDSLLAAPHARRAGGVGRGYQDLPLLAARDRADRGQAPSRPDPPGGIRAPARARAPDRRSAARPARPV